MAILTSARTGRNDCFFKDERSFEWLVLMAKVLAQFRSYLIWFGFNMVGSSLIELDRFGKQGTFFGQRDLDQARGDGFDNSGQERVWSVMVLRVWTRWVNSVDSLGQRWSFNIEREGIWGLRVYTVLVCYRAMGLSSIIILDSIFCVVDDDKWWVFLFDISGFRFGSMCSRRLYVELFWVIHFFQLSEFLQVLCVWNWLGVIRYWLLFGRVVWTKPVKWWFCESVVYRSYRSLVFSTRGRNKLVCLKCGVWLVSYREVGGRG